MPLDNLNAKDRSRTITLGILFAYNGRDHKQKIQTEGLPLLQKEQQEILKDYLRDIIKVLSDVLIEIVPRKIKNDKVILRNITMSLCGMLYGYFIWTPNEHRKATGEYTNTITELAISGAAHFEIAQ